METVRVNLGPRSYAIRLTQGDTAKKLGAFAPKAAAALIVADANVSAFAAIVNEALIAAGVKTITATVPPGETSKSLQVLAQLYDVLANIPADRQTLVVAVGGGVIGDLAGFAAATFNRGLPLLMVPTTLLAMVDSSVGGKTAVNHARGKNLIGAFHQPACVWADLASLATLPEREFRSGLAEAVKYGVILDAMFFEWIEANAQSLLQRNSTVLAALIARCCRLKADIVEKDEREETGQRVVLNYGHTFGHAFEILGSYTEMLHGEAVAAGMVVASRLAEKLGRCDRKFVDRQIALLRRFSLPVTINKAWPPEALIQAMRSDKKTQAGKLRFVLPSRLGLVELVDGVDEAAVREVLAQS